MLGYSSLVSSCSPSVCQALGFISIKPWVSFPTLEKKKKKDHLCFVFISHCELKLRRSCLCVTELHTVGPQVGTTWQQGRNSSSCQLDQIWNRVGDILLE